MQTSCKLTQSYQDKIIKELELLPERKPKIWSEFEINMLRKYYLIRDPKDIAKVLHRSVNEVWRQAGLLGLSRKSKL